MGAAPNSYSPHAKITANRLFSGVPSLERLFLVLDDLITTAETVRLRIISSRELMLRITKVSLLSQPRLIHAFKVWCWVVIACNDGSAANVRFSVDLNDVGAPGQPFMQEELSQEYCRLFNYVCLLFQFKGSNVASIILPNVCNYDNDKLVDADYGKCGDLRFQIWPAICQEYIAALKKALQLVPYLCTRFRRYMERLSETSEVEAVKSVVAKNQKEYQRAQGVLEFFQSSLNRHLEELTEFVQQHKEIFSEAESIGRRVYEDYEITQYSSDSQLFIIKSKINQVVADHFKEFDFRTAKQNEIEIGYKKIRKLNKPIYDSERILYDSSSPASQFPTKFHWVYSPYFDTLFAAQSVALSELETARKIGDEARKGMFKQTNVGMLADKSVASAVEVWLVYLVGSLGPRFQELNLCFVDHEPWVRGKFDDPTLNLPQSAESFRKDLSTFIGQYSPGRFRKLSNFLNDYLIRWDTNFKEKMNFHKIIQKEVEPIHQYNALTNFYKNLRANDIYLDRVKRLFEVVIKYNGELCQKLFDKQEEIFQSALRLGPLAERLELNEIVVKLMSGQLADNQLIQQRKSSRYQSKITINYYNEKKSDILK